MRFTTSRAHRWIAAARALAALCTLTAAAPAARAEVVAYDEHDGEAGGTVGWSNDWPFTRSDGELVQTVGYQRRYFSAPLSVANDTLWIAVTGRMAAPAVGYAYHVPMGVTSWTADHQHAGLHFDTSSTFGLFVGTSTPNSGVVATTQQTWLSRYVFGPANANGRFNAAVSVWSGSGAGRRIDTRSAPAAVYTLPDTTLDSLYASQGHAADTFFVERESVATSALEALAAPERDLYVVAHQDDDLLFMNPDIAFSIQAGNPVQTVYVTAGAGGQEASFMDARESGMKAAYAAMAGLANDWTCADATVAGKNLVRCGLNGSAGRVELVFLRLPSIPNGSDGPELSDLWSGSVGSLPRYDDPSVTYTRPALVGVLASLMTLHRATRIGILNSDHGEIGDHVDHRYASLFAFAAQQVYTAAHDLRTYRGYDISPNEQHPLWEQENVSEEEFDITWDTFRWYAQCSHVLCDDTSACGSSNACQPENNAYLRWAKRRYVGSMVTGVSGHIRTAGGKCLQVAGGATANGTPVQIADCAQTAAQQWTVSEGGIQGPGGKCLTAAGGSNASGTTVWISECANAASKRWTMLDNGKIRGVDGRCLAVEGMNAPNGAPVSIDDCDTSEVQQLALQHALPTVWSQGIDFSDSQLGTTSVYTRTVRLGDVNGDGRDDACVRRSDGVWCARSNGSAFSAAARYTLEFSDANGWAPEAYGQTIQLADVNGDGRADICGRGIGGILCQVANASGTAFVTAGRGLSWSTDFSDASGFTTAQSYYRSIRLGDVNGDSYADVCGRYSDGVWCALSMGNGFAAATLWEPLFSNANGWQPVQYGTTLQLGDINGDGTADICGRGPSGVVCAVARAVGPGFERAHVWSYSWKSVPDFGGSAFDAEGYSGSLDLADVDGDGDADLCGRGAEGALCASSNGLSFGKALHASLGAFADASGWLPPRYGATVQLGDVNGDGRADLCGRDVAGIRCALAP